MQQAWNNHDWIATAFLATRKSLHSLEFRFPNHGRIQLCAWHFPTKWANIKNQQNKDQRRRRLRSWKFEEKRLENLFLFAASHSSNFQHVYRCNDLFWFHEVTYVLKKSWSLNVCYEKILLFVMSLPPNVSCHRKNHHNLLSSCTIDELLSGNKSHGRKVPFSPLDEQSNFAHLSVSY